MKTDKLPEWTRYDHPVQKQLREQQVEIERLAAENSLLKAELNIQKQPKDSYTARVIAAHAELIIDNERLTAELALRRYHGVAATEWLKQRDRYNEALEIIAGKRQCVDNLMSNQDIATAALNGEHEVAVCPFDCEEDSCEYPQCGCEID